MYISRKNILELGYLFDRLYIMSYASIHFCTLDSLVLLYDYVYDRLVIPQKWITNYENHEIFWNIEYFIGWNSNCYC